jgi:hypothetical protein
MNTKIKLMHRKAVAALISAKEARSRRTSGIRRRPAARRYSRRMETEHETFCAFS